MSRVLRIVQKNYLTVFILSVGGVALVQGRMHPLPFDDAFITYRYARNISEGLGFVYNQGEYVLGTTTPLFTLLLAAVSRVLSSEQIPLASFFISVASDAINVWLIFRLTRFLFKNTALATIASIAFLFHPFRLNVAAGGMETSVFIMGLLLMYDRYLIGKRAISASIWAAFAVMVRPDAGIAIVPLYIDWFIQDPRRAGKGFLLNALLLAPWMIWATAYFGSPLPQSMIAKSVTYKNPPGHAAYFLLTFFGTGTIGPYMSPGYLIPGLVITIPMIMAGLRFISKEMPAALVPGLYPVLYFSIMGLVNPPMYFSWYFLPLLPGLILLIISAMIYLSGNKTSLGVVLVGVILCFALVLPAYLLKFQPGWALSRSREAAYWDACHALSDRELDQKTVMAPDIGVLGWCLAGTDILDPIGLVSPQAVEINRNMPPDQLVSPQLISSGQPDYIIALDQYISDIAQNDRYFIENYEQIFMTDVVVADTIQPLFVYQLLSAND